MTQMANDSVVDLENLAIDIDKLVADGVLTRDEARALEHSQQSDSGGAMRMEALPETAGLATTDGGSAAEDKDSVKEAAVKHKRHWVRVTRVCNQRCTFCLDSMNQDGSYIDVDSLKAYIALGRKMGRQRLILSGGEASVHPEYIELIRYGKQVGYEWIQTVTNGMMFAYKKFARACAEAGLDEATVSMHGHTAKLHDKLTGTRGAYVTGIKGIQNLQATNRVVVNVDVVINKQNYRHLPEIIEHYYNMGIREFDLLHIIPFGRGFDEHRHSLFFDLNDAAPYFRRAFEWSKKPGVYLWTNRLPVAYLEGNERLIQDPHKLFYEFDGGRHNFEGFLKRGIKPDCYGERCDYCFLDGACRSTMLPYRAHNEAGTFPTVRLRGDQSFAGSSAQQRFADQRPERAWFVAEDADEGGRMMAANDFGDAAITMELASGADPKPLLKGGKVGRFVIRSTEDAASYLVGKNKVEGVEVEVLLDLALAQWLLARPSTIKAWGDKLICTLRNHEYLSESQATDPDPATLRKLANLGARLKNVPECIAQAPTLPHDHGLLDAGMLDAGGDLDLDGYVHHYIESEYYAKSLRCHRCDRFDSCKGLHVNYLRSHGFDILQPLDAAGAELQDADSFEKVAEALKEATAAQQARQRKETVGKHSPDRNFTAIALDKMTIRHDPMRKKPRTQPT